MTLISDLITIKYHFCSSLPFHPGLAFVTLINVIRCHQVRHLVALQTISYIIRRTNRPIIRWEPITRDRYASPTSSALAKQKLMQPFAAECFFPPISIHAWKSHSPGRRQHRISTLQLELQLEPDTFKRILHRWPSVPRYEMKIRPKSLNMFP